MVDLHCVFHGRVQGVGFRIRMKEKADALGVVGWVKNCPDGTVEAVLHGRALDVDRLLDYCGMLGDVQYVDREDVPDSDLEGFSIRY